MEDLAGPQDLSDEGEGAEVSFGIYPAVRAARLDPIEALRYE